MLEKYVNKDIFTVQHLAEILQKKNYEVYELLHTGEIESFRIERKYLVLKSDLFHYMNKACITG